MGIKGGERQESHCWHRRGIDRAADLQPSESRAYITQKLRKSIQATQALMQFTPEKLCTRVSGFRPRAHEETLIQLDWTAVQELSKIYAA